VLPFSPLLVLLPLCELFRNLDKLELPVYSVKAHREIINAIDGVGGVGVGEGAPEIATAGRDGIVYAVVYTLYLL